MKRLKKEREGVGSYPICLSVYPLPSGYILQLLRGHPGLCPQVMITYTRNPLKAQLYEYGFRSVRLTFGTFIEPHSAPDIFHLRIY